MSSENPSSSDEKKPVLEKESSSYNKEMTGSASEMSFAIIPKESIKLMGEASGYADLSDDVLALISEDISYRIREVTMNSTQYMKHGKRRKLNTEDFNKALRQMDVQPVYGHGSGDVLTFKQTKEGDIHFVEDAEVNFCDVALGKHVPKNIGETTIKVDWLAVEGVVKSSTLGKGKKELSEDLLNYYNNITKSLLDVDPQLRMIALNDLRVNPNIVPLLSYFVNYVCYGVKTVSHDISKLTILLHAITSLINNPNLDFSPQPYLNLLVQAIMYNLTEPVATSFNNTNDHWSLRDYAARLLGEIVRKWSNPLNHLLYNTVKELKDVLFDLNKPFCSHYGAVMGLIALGTKTVEEILLPNLSSFWSHLNMAMEDTSIRNALVRADAYKVYGALLLAAEKLIKKRFEDFKKENGLNTESSENNSVQDVEKRGSMFAGAKVLIKTPHELYSELYEYFGDSLTLRVDQTSTVNFQEVFPVTKEEKLVSLSDADGLKTGEELLEEFMEQVRVQEILDKEKKIKEEKDKVRREKLEAEQKVLQQQKDVEDRRRQMYQAMLKQKQEEENMKRWEEEKQRKDGERQKDEALRRDREKRKRQERRKREEDRRRMEEERRKEELLITMRLPRREGTKINYKEDDDDIDVEADDDSDYVPDHPVTVEKPKSDQSENTDEYHSDGQIKQVQPQPGTSQENVAITSMITNPGGGIKIKIKKQYMKSDECDSGTPERKEKKKRKRKSSLKSDSKVDPFEFSEKSDTDDYTVYRPHGLTPQQYHTPSGGDSSESDTFRKSKLTLKLKVASPHLSDSSKK